jgi:hypothetical protein
MEWGKYMGLPKLPTKCDLYNKMSLLPEDPENDWQIDLHFIEEAAHEALDHRALGVNLRGL